jgi:Na+-driven multidrug efflux pump
MGATAMIGQNIGAGKMERVKQIYLSGCVLCIAFCTLFGLMAGIFPTSVFRLFTDDIQVLLYAKMCVFCIIVELPAKMFMASGGALLNGSGNVKLSMILGLCDAFVGRIFLTWLLGKVMGFGEFGYFLGYGLGTYIMAVPQVIYYLSGSWKNRTAVVKI